MNRELGIRDVEPLNPIALHPPFRVDVSQVRISGLMSRKVVSVIPDTSVEALTWLLLERGIGAVPVINDDGKLVGVVSIADLLNEVQDRGDAEERILLRMHHRRVVQKELDDGFHVTCLARATVEEIMTPVAVTLPETATVAQAAALMVSKRLSHLPVVTSGKVVGMLTALDVMRCLARSAQREGATAT